MMIRVELGKGGRRPVWAPKRAAIGSIYARAFAIYKDMPFAAGNLFQDDPSRAPVQKRVMDSAQYLADHMGDAPVLLVPCIDGRVDGQPGFLSASVWGSLFPAVWSFMLAARARGLGTAWTTVHLEREADVANVVGIPCMDVTQVALIPVARTIGTEFRPATRRPLDAVVHWDAW